MPQQLDTGLFSIIDTDSSIGVGWKLNFYVTGTSTRKNTYPTSADASAGTNANANPVIVPADGRIPSVWFLDDADYKCVLADENDVVKETVDPINDSRITSSSGAGFVGWINSGASAVATTVQDRLRQSVSVLDFIPTAKHAGIKAGTNTDDLTTYFQAAVVAANSGGSVGGIVYVPLGTYNVTKIGIRDTVIVGQHRDATIIKGYSAGTNADFILDAALDRDGTTANTVGNGWAENLTIDANNTARSCLRTYGGGARPANLVFKNTTGYGLRMGLPIWSLVSNCRAVDCDAAGFSTYASSDTGTSTTFTNCWADSCGTYGFHIANLYYSSFINCVSQDCGTYGIYVEGNAGGLSALYSLQFIGCGHEGTGTPFYFKKVRELTVDNPRIISPASSVHYITFDDCTGSVRDYSTVSTPTASFYHLNITNHAGGNGAILLYGGDLTIPTAQGATVTQVGGLVNSTRRFASNNALLSGSISSPSALGASENDYSIAVDASIVRLTPNSGGSTITGMQVGSSAGGTAGQQVLLQNLSGADNITLSHASGSSSAGNQFQLPSGSNVTISPLQSVVVWYDGTTQRWRKYGA